MEWNQPFAGVVSENTGATCTPVEEEDNGVMPPLRTSTVDAGRFAVEEASDDGVRDGEQAVIIAHIVVAVTHANRHLNGAIAFISFVSPFSCRYHVQSVV